ncbi:MAG: ADP-ribose pyrophosphatase [Planctomycetes bacterium RBG_13_60_9]|nr:MAG: ADP-ribose pyrophosphatase [Planctomycetes bacterium RBG_13_60_9]
MEPNWLTWAKRLAALAQNGLTYSDNEYEIDRYEQIRQIAAEMMAAGSHVGTKAFLDLFSREQGYATPKVDVRGAVFRDNKILLVKEKIDNGWTLPGGWADPCQSPSEAVVREIFEESGFEARAVKLAAVYDRSKHPHQPPMPFHLYKMFFLCEITGGQAKESHETTGVEFFAENEIPEPLSISRTLPFQIARMFEHHRNPALPTDFD